MTWLWRSWSGPLHMTHKRSWRRIRGFSRTSLKRLNSSALSATSASSTLVSHSHTLSFSLWFRFIFVFVFHLLSLYFSDVLLFEDSVGACVVPPNLCIITEFASRGSLSDHLYGPVKKIILLSLHCHKHSSYDCLRALFNFSDWLVVAGRPLVVSPPLIRKRRRFAWDSCTLFSFRKIYIWLSSFSNGNALPSYTHSNDHSSWPEIWQCSNHV